MDAKTRNTAERAAFFGFGRGDTIAADPKPTPERNTSWSDAAWEHAGRVVGEKAPRMGAMPSEREMQELRNVVACLLTAVNAPAGPHRLLTIREVSRQLGDFVNLRGFPAKELTGDECPF